MFKAWNDASESICYNLTCLSVSDPVVAHGDRWSVPADGDAGGGGVKHLQVCGSVRDCGGGGGDQI